MENEEEEATTTNERTNDWRAKRWLVDDGSRTDEYQMYQMYVKLYNEGWVTSAETQ